MERYLEFLFTLTLVIGIFVLMSGVAGAHGHFSLRPDRPGDWLVILTPLAGLMGLVLLMMRKSRLDSNSFKTEISETEEFKKLINLLEQAMALTKERNVQTISTGLKQDFYNRLTTSVERLKNLELEEIENIWTWFGPKAEWDIVAGEEGADLGSAIFTLIEQVRSQL